MKRLLIGLFAILLIGVLDGGGVSAENSPPTTAQNSTVPTTIFLVDSTGDEPDPNILDNQCIATSGQCTLRAAIMQANYTAGTDIIRFDFPSSVSILPDSELPEITERVIIDGINGTGATCPTATSSANLKISLSGFNAPSNSNGLTIGPSADNSVISGLNIVLWQGNTTLGGAGILIEHDSDYNIITCNHIGISNLSISGSQNRTGIIVQGNYNEIGGTDDERNVIVATEDGIRITDLSDTATDNVIRNNYIGTNHAATAAIGSMRNGITIDGNTNTIRDNVIGGASKIVGAGISIGGDNNTIIRNNIGTDVTGLIAIPNYFGITISDPPPNQTYTGMLIGGSAANGNIIAHNSSTGIAINSSSNASPTIISHNNIHHNGGSGVRISNGTGNTIESNDIHDNGSHGVYVEGVPVSLGADVLSNTIFDNGGSGFYSFLSASLTGEIVSNVIYGNADDGITTNFSANLRLNEIYNNGHLGIDRRDDGISTDFAPLLGEVSALGHIVGGYGDDGGTATIEVFVSDSCDDQLSGGIPYGEGQTLFSTHTVTLSNDGKFDFFTSTLPIGKGITVLHHASNATSEFSNCVLIELATFIVNSTNNNNDANPGDGFCATSGSGFCTLTAAIDEVNALGNGPHRIEFALGSGTKLINPYAPLIITTPVIIDGSTYDNSSCPTATTPANLKIQVAGLLLQEPNANTKNILTLGNGSDGSEIRGLAFIAGPSDGLRINSDNNIIACNLFGIQVDGNAGGNVDDGVHVAAGNNNRIGMIDDYADRNVFADNGGAGVQLTTGSIGTIISGNYIGTDLAGEAALPNGYGIDVTGSSNHTLIGGTEPEQANIIAGNSTDGVRIASSSSVTITENIVGLFSDDSAGGNGRYNVQVTGASYVTVGDFISGDGAIGNRIKHSGSHGVYIVDSTNVIVESNEITDAGENGNGSGIAVVRSSGVLIGGTHPLFGNAIYDNVGSGIYMNDTVSDVTVQNNEIGVLGFGGSMSGNTFDGIHANETVSDVTIKDNFLRYNNRNGIRVDNDSTGIVMLNNRIYENGSIGIDLGEDGVTANDLSDRDTGANGKTNYPIIISADSDTQRIEAELNAKPATQYLVQFFSNDACLNGNPREGFVFSREKTVLTDINGYAAVVGLGGISIGDGDGITATATEVNGDGTSEFSPCVVAVDGVPTAVAVSEQGTVSSEQWAVLMVTLIVLSLCSGVALARRI